jgi:hypothetical protein
MDRGGSCIMFSGVFAVDTCGHTAKGLRRKECSEERKSLEYICTKAYKYEVTTWSTHRTANKFAD